MEDPPRRRWSQRGQDVGAVLWPSFLVACGGSIVTFALLDPAVLGLHDGAQTLDRMSGYALGFFLFWAIGAASSVLTLYLARTAHEGS